MFDALLNYVYHFNHDSINPTASYKIYPQSILGVLGLILLQLALYIYAIGFTGPNSHIRPAVLPLVIICEEILRLKCVDILPRFVINNIVRGLECNWLFQYIASGILQKENFEDGGPAMPEIKRKGLRRKESGSFFERVWFGFKTINYHRRIGTPQQAKYIPPFSKNDSNYIPSQSEFLGQAVLTIVLCGLAFDGMSTLWVSLERSPSSARGTSPIPGIMNISLLDLGIRSANVIRFWMILYLFLTIAYSALSFVAVGLGLYEPKAWPPMFGSVQEIYSIRQFWGVFFHQMLRCRLETISNFVIDDILHFSKGTITRRYASIFMVFLLSGLFHLMTDVWAGISVGESGAVQFFCSFAPAIMLEDGIQALYRRVALTEGRSTEPQLWARLLGFTWTIAFLTLMTPTWIDMDVRETRGNTQEEVVPFSVIKLLLKYV